MLLLWDSSVPPGQGELWGSGHTLNAQGIRSDAILASGVIWDGAGVEINPHPGTTGEGIQGLAVCVPGSLHL